MTAHNSALQRVCFQALSADPALTTLLGADRIFDRVPERVRPPYVVLGQSMVSDWSTATEDGEAIVFFIHVWSKSSDRDQCHAAQQEVKRVLESGLSLPATNLVALRFQLTDTRRDRPSGYLHGVMRFRAVIEPQ